MNENFINFHILISHSPSCLNRDDMNMQKSAVFGGKRRVRISSQSLKRTMRHSDYYRQHLGEPSVRTRELGDFRNMACNQLSDSFPEEIINKAISFWGDARGLDEYNATETAVAPWLIHEISAVCQALADNNSFMDICDSFIAIKGNGDADKKKKRSLINKAIKLLKKEEKWESILLASANGLDIALSGRMATSGLMTNIDGALAVAHAITTHTVDADIDWFTAVDDLQEQGSGHLDTQEFSSGVFYRYASLNLKQLQVNLGLLADMKSEETLESRAKALDIAAHVLHMLATEVPSAKQQSFAAHNLADLALVSFSSQPVSLANAFEEPIKPARNGGFREPSMQALNEYWDKVHKGYGLQERCAEFSLVQRELPNGIESKPSLPELEGWVRDNGKA